MGEKEWCRQRRGGSMHGQVHALEVSRIPRYYLPGLHQISPGMTSMHANRKIALRCCFDAALPSMLPSINVHTVVAITVQACRPTNLLEAYLVNCVCAQIRK